MGFGSFFVSRRRGFEEGILIESGVWEGVGVRFERYRESLVIWVFMGWFFSSFSFLGI